MNVIDTLPLAVSGFNSTAGGDSPGKIWGYLPGRHIFVVDKDHDLEKVMTIIMLHDCIDPSDPLGRSYKQVNAEKTHALPKGALVELDSGVRLFIAFLGRDCDQTPLYWLTPDLMWIEGSEIFEENHYIAKGHWVGGYPDDSLKLIRLP